jgi:hypothetical protein
MRLYYQPNGGISLLPEIRGMVDVAVFGCVAADDYRDGAVLFHSTRNAARTMESEVRRFQPDCVLVETFNLDMLEALIRVRSFYSGPIVAFYGDTILTQPIRELLTRAGKYLNLLLVVDRSDEAMLRIHGVPAEFTVSPVCESVYKHVPRAPEYDVVMAANHYSSQAMPNADQRILLAQLLHANFPNFAMFGPLSWSQFGVPSRGWVDEYQLAAVFNAARIVVTCDSVIGKRLFTSARTYKALFAGAFLLIRRFLGIEELFTNKTHLVWFESNDEALALVRYYLQNDAERASIAHEGMTHARRLASARDLFINWTSRASAIECRPSDRATRNDLLWLAATRAKRIALNLVRTHV